MRIRADHAKCQGHARCHALCPEVFEVDEETDKVRILVDEVPSDLRERAERAVDNCPEEALETIDGP